MHLTSFDKEFKQVYDLSDIDNFNYDQSLGQPGKFPFTRGIHDTMYRQKLWTMRQYAGFGTAEETNKRFHYLLEQGQTGLSVAFDLPTQMGRDSDHKLCKGEVGKTGVAIDTLADMEELFKGIPLDKVSTSMTINAPASVLLLMYAAVAEKQGVNIRNLQGTIQNDILKEYIARNTFIYPPKPSLRLIVDTCTYCSQYLPKWNSLSVSGYHIREAGSTSVQEVAFTLANAKTYLLALQAKGIDIDVVAPRLSFFFSATSALLEEIAKFRAAKRLWANIAKNELNAKSPKSWLLRFHCQTGGSTLTSKQIENNIVRTTIEALAAVLGGAQSLHTNSHDEALSLPSETAVRTALRIQQVIAYETDLPYTVDPIGGSYAVESLTNMIEEEAKEYMKKIDEKGGVLNAIEQGYLQKEIQESSYKYQCKIENSDKIVVGVNKFIIDEEKKIKIYKSNPEVENKQIQKLEQIKQTRNNNEVKEKLDSIKNTAKTDENLMPYIFEAVKAYATIGEICDVLREVFGEYHEPGW